MDEKLKNQIVKLECSINKEDNTVIVSAQLRSRWGRNKPVVLTVQAVRDWLLFEKQIQTEEHLSGSEIHNNMSRRLGNRTIDDLKQDYLFRLPAPAVEVKPTPVVKPKAKPAPKPKTKVAKVEEVSAKPTPRREATTTTAAKTTKAKTTTRSRRNNSTKKLTKDSE